MRLPSEKMVLHRCMLMKGEHGEVERWKIQLVQRDWQRTDVDLLEDSLMMEVNITLVVLRTMVWENLLVVQRQNSLIRS